MNSKVGEMYTTNEGYRIEIVEYFSTRNCTVRFLGYGRAIIYKKQYANIKRGVVSNPYHKSVSGIGFLSIGKFKSIIGGIRTKEYKTWLNLLGRCYKDNKRPITYKDCTVDERWHDFQVFGKWFEENYNPETMQGWQLDKDILVKGNKIYSPENCCFVPQEINTLFRQGFKSKYQCSTGIFKQCDKFTSMYRGTYLGKFNTPEEAFEVYKTTKEQYLKEVADYWKNTIDPKVHQAMYNYRVEIID
jgi:hypothetical protein